MAGNEEEKKKIKELEEKVRKLEEAVKAGNEEKVEREEEEEVEEEEGGTGIEMAEEIIGGFFPGLGKMVKGLKKSEAFKERFEEVDREIEERMKEGGREISRGRYSIGKRPGPHIEADYSVRTLVGEKHEPSSRRVRGREEVQRRREKERVKEIRVDKEEIKEKEPLIDIMDEKDCIMVIAEMPGVDEKDIKTEIGDGGGKLIISTEGEGGKSKYYKEVDLPSEVKGEIKRMYKHGVLEVRLEKEVEKKEDEKK